MPPFYPTMGGTPHCIILWGLRAPYYCITLGRRPLCAVTLSYWPAVPVTMTDAMMNAAAETMLLAP